MPTVDVKNLNNEKVGEMKLSDDVFGVELNESLIYYAVNNYLTNQRQGTVGTKTRGNVSGSGRKLWKQKGTGRARIASLRSPLWKGGGNVLRGAFMGAVVDPDLLEGRVGGHVVFERNREIDEAPGRHHAGFLLPSRYALSA